MIFQSYNITKTDLQNTLGGFKSNYSGIPSKIFVSFWEVAGETTLKSLFDIFSENF